MILSSENCSEPSVLVSSVLNCTYGVVDHLNETHHLRSSSCRGGIFPPISAMSSMPYAMRMVQSEKKRQSKQEQPSGFADGSSGTFSTSFENPTMYSSKMMNSIWGMYNKYSVHNFKSKQCDGPQGTGSSGVGESSTFSQANASSNGNEGPYKCSGSGRPSSSYDFSYVATDVAVGLANAMTKFY